MKLVPGSDGGMTGQMDVRTDPTIRSDQDVFVDDRGLIYLIDRGRGLTILERV